MTVNNDENYSQERRLMLKGCPFKEIEIPLVNVTNPPVSNISIKSAVKKNNILIARKQSK